MCSIPFLLCGVNTLIKPKTDVMIQCTQRGHKTGWVESQQPLMGSDAGMMGEDLYGE
jgi:hypothetical protein